MMQVDGHRTSVDICVCTFRRSFLAETLASIGRLRCAELSVRVIVTDNDFVASALPLVESIRRQVPWPILYQHAPAANISVARNACLEAASAEFIAFVDDDELVTEDWLNILVETALATGAGAVFGPVRAVYDADAPRWMREGDFHSTAPVLVDGEVTTGYTCNALIRWTGAVRGQRFDPALGRSGGEDTDFFYRLHDQGVRLAAACAVVIEPVPSPRASLLWLARRRFRSGQTYGAHLLSKRSPFLPSLMLAGAKLCYCAAATILTLASSVGWRRNLLRGTLHAGVVAGLLRSRQAELYGSRREPDPVQVSSPSSN